MREILGVIRELYAEVDLFSGNILVIGNNELIYKCSQWAVGFFRAYFSSLFYSILNYLIFGTNLPHGSINTHKKYRQQFPLRNWVISEIVKSGVISLIKWKTAYSRCLIGYYSDLKVWLTRKKYVKSSSAIICANPLPIYLSHTHSKQTLLEMSN